MSTSSDPMRFVVSSSFLASSAFSCNTFCSCCSNLVSWMLSCRISCPLSPFSCQYLMRKFKLSDDDEACSYVAVLQQRQRQLKCCLYFLPFSIFEAVCLSVCLTDCLFVCLPVAVSLVSFPFCVPACHSPVYLPV